MRSQKHVTKLFLVLLALITTSNNEKVWCFPLSYSRFPSTVDNHFIKSGEAYIVHNALQVTMDVRGANITDLSGRILYNKRFKLWNKKRIASFNSTFVLNITPQQNGGGEGLAFILTKDSKVPANSHGQWLGIVNASTNGSSDSKIMAIEFDTKKSFPQDIDGNHVGLNINSVYSETQVSLNSSNITIASGEDITTVIIYDGLSRMMNVLVFKGNQTGPESSVPIMSVPLDLSQHLPSKVYVGFSASTGSGSELNCVKSWYFTGTELDSVRPLWFWVVISISITVALSLSLFGVYLYWRQKHRTRHVTPGDDPTIQRMETGLGLKKIRLKDLKAATGNFNAKNELGRGGFGIVYKGTWEGNAVAVKRIINTPQGKQNLIAEVTTIGSLHHKNLVKLQGWCYESDELLLVYEYMPNGSLDKFIYSCTSKDHENEKSTMLCWEKRHNIICGVAQALDYLHNECSKRVLHRDIKASNIMLDSEFNACLGDFGLARMFKLSEKTHHTTKEIAGTPGYMAPEIFHTGRTTAETDVFAFGVLTLVVACGKKPGVQTDDKEYNDSIIDWVWELHKLEILDEAIDARLKGKFDCGQAECMLVLGLACCHPNPHMRPTMRNALQILMGEALPPLVPFEKPVFMWPATPPSFNREDSLSGGMLTPFSTLSGR